MYATPSEIKHFQAPLASRVTQLALIDALFVFLALKHKSRTAAKLQASGEELIKRQDRVTLVATAQFRRHLFDARFHTAAYFDVRNTAPLQLADVPFVLFQTELGLATCAVLDEIEIRRA